MPERFRRIKSMARPSRIRIKAEKLLRLQGRPDSSVAEIAKVVEVDAGLRL